MAGASRTPAAPSDAAPTGAGEPSTFASLLAADSADAKASEAPAANAGEPPSDSAADEAPSGVAALASGVLALVGKSSAAAPAPQGAERQNGPHPSRPGRATAAAAAVLAAGLGVGLPLPSSAPVVAVGEPAASDASPSAAPVAAAQAEPSATAAVAAQVPPPAASAAVPSAGAREGREPGSRETPGVEVSVGTPQSEVPAATRSGGDGGPSAPSPLPLADAAPSTAPAAAAAETTAAAAAAPPAVAPAKPAREHAAADAQPSEPSPAVPAAHESTPPVAPPTPGRGAEHREPGGESPTARQVPAEPSPSPTSAPGATPPSVVRAEARAVASQAEPPAGQQLERFQQLEPLRHGPVRDDGEMRLEVASEGLGRVELRVAVRDDAVHASLLVQQDHAREALTAHRPALEAALGRSQLRLEEFTVGVGQHGHSPERDEQGAPDGRPAPLHPTPAPTPAPEPAAPRAALAGGLSLRA